jgi:DNA/RNA-binding domain of Phe-tRNA-synthetase-like protein
MDYGKTSNMTKTFWTFCGNKYRRIMIQLSIDESIVRRWSGEAVLACCFLHECENIQTLDPDFEREVSTTIAELRGVADVLCEPRLEQMRETFRAMPDMNPKRYKPASEALIQRCLTGGLFRIKPLVDVNNLLSVRLRLPLGIYDMTGFQAPSWVYRIGFPSEQYLTITQKPKSAEGKLVLADSQGVVGSPIADSGRAAVKETGERIGIIAFLPFGFTSGMASEVATKIQKTFNKYHHPKTSEIRVICKE